MSAAEDPPHEIEALLGVSRETLDRLKVYAGLLRRWNVRINLVAPATLAMLWRRHIADCAQLSVLAPNAKTWIDLGSGAGLPGLIVAAIRQDQIPLDQMVLVESDIRKSAFMAEASRAMELNVQIETRRIEDSGRNGAPQTTYDVVSARALAPLDRLLELADPYMSSHSVALFSKGRTVGLELTAARSHWNMRLDSAPSITDTEAVILKVKELSRARNP